MDDISGDLAAIAARCEAAVAPLGHGPIYEQIKKLYEVISDIGASWSGAWLGYHAEVYLDGLRPRRPGEHFDSEWPPDSHMNRTRGPWAIHTYDEVRTTIMERAGVPDLAHVEAAVKEAREGVEEAKERLLPLLDALLSTGEDQTLRKIRDDIAEARGVNRDDWVLRSRPTNFMTRDTLAATQFQQGYAAPPHLGFEAWIGSQWSVSQQAMTVGKLARRAGEYLRQRDRLRRGGYMPQTSKRVFIGHGHSLMWRELQGFIQNTLHLEYDEFNREPAAGIPTSERLQIMLDHAAFALIVMTAEDAHAADQALHARENVVHEAGLFQGRLGFRKAIVVLEETCALFSNIEGLGQIRFPCGRIRACFEEVREVLEREQIIEGA